MGDINIGNGAMEMNTEAVTGAMSALTQTGQTFESDRTSAEAAIFAKEPEIGTGDLAQGFRPKYEKSKDSLTESAKKIREVLDAYAEGGNQAVADYITTDQERAAQIRRSSAV